MRRNDGPGIPEIRKRRLAEILFGLACFLVLSCFFISAHPIIVLDSDDWVYLFFSRAPYPKTNLWNPARVFPEQLMPFVSMLSVRLLGPLAHGDPILALSWGFAMTVSAFFGLYCAAFLRFVHARLEVGGWKALCLGILFVIFHFVSFRFRGEHNPYLLASKDATCYFYYNIPALLCGALILFLLTDDLTEDFFSAKRIGAKALFLLTVYCCIFSNVFESVMPALFCGVRILFSLLKKEKRTFRAFLRENGMRALIILTWLISLVYEAKGGRAESLPPTEPMSSAFLAGCRALATWVLKFNRVTIVVFAVVLAAAAILLLIRWRKGSPPQGTLAAELAVNGALMGLYTLILCARTGAERMSRPEVLLSCMFYLLVFISIAGAYILKTRERSALLLPLLVFILFFEISTRRTTFQESYLVNWTPEQCFAVSRDIVSRMQEADRAGAEEIVLQVPVITPEDKWFAFADLGQNQYSDALYKLGVISRRIKTTMEPSEEYNRRFGLPEE